MKTMIKATNLVKISATLCALSGSLSTSIAWAYSGEQPRQEQQAQQPLLLRPVRIASIKQEVYTLCLKNTADLDTLGCLKKTGTCTAKEVSKLIFPAFSACLHTQDQRLHTQIFQFATLDSEDLVNELNKLFDDGFEQVSPEVLAFSLAQSWAKNHPADAVARFYISWTLGNPNSLRYP